MVNIPAIEALFPVRMAQAANAASRPSTVAWPETRENMEILLSVLDHVPADADYETWRNSIWAIGSTGWASARQIAHKWSAKAPHRYEVAAVDNLLASFDPAKGITLGTLIHHAQQNGWTGHSSHTMPTQSSLIIPIPPVPLIAAGQCLLTATQLRQLPPTRYVVRGLLPARGQAAIYGEPGSGKSFLAIDLAHAIASGRTDWFGFHVQQAPVAYVALEGQGGIGKRIDALEAHTGRPCDDQLRFWCHDIQLLDDKGIGMLAAQIVATLGTGAVVVIDTLNQASPGADENSSQDMGKIIAATKRLAVAVGGLVLLVHHAGKNRSLGLRGHSSLLAAMDAVIEVAKDASGRIWRVTKAKDDSGDVERNFDLVSYPVGQDAFGPITSCAVQQAARVSGVKKAPVTGKHQKAALAELRRLLTPPGQTMTYQNALQHVAAVIVTAKPNDRAKEALDTLIRGGHLSLVGVSVTLA